MISMKKKFCTLVFCYIIVFKINWILIEVYKKICFASRTYQNNETKWRNNKFKVI